MDKSKLAGYLNPKRLELILLPTENCNFRCTYCYEDFEIGQMKENTVQAVKNLMKNRIPKLTHFSILWFGGEPLMAKNLVLELSQFAKEQCKQAGVEFTSSLTTNAYALTRDLFDSLSAVNVRRFQVSLDGDADEHNKTRKLISGRGTFERIWNNLLAMRDSSEKFDVLLRIHIHTENIDSLRALLPKIAAEFGADPRYTLTLKAVGNWGGESVKQMHLVKKSSDIIAEFKQTLQSLGWFGNRPETVEVNAATASPCYAARSNSFVVRADGRLAKCTVAFNDPRNVVGHINDDGTLHIINEKVQGFMRGFQSLDDKELLCPMHDMPEANEVKVIKFEKRPRVELEAIA